MSWATRVKIQNLGLADTCSPSGKKWYQIPERTGLKRVPAARLKKHIRSDFFFFSGWLSIALFTRLCTIQLVFLASQSVVVDQQPVCWAGQPIETDTQFFIKPQNNAVLCLFWGQKHYGRGWAGERRRQSNKKIKKSWCAIATLTKQVQFFSGRCVVDTHTSHTPQ